MINPLKRIVSVSTDALGRFIGLEAAGGILLFAAAVAALIVGNSPLAGLYEAALETRVTILVDGYGVDKPFLYWINDGLMAVFFLLVGLEIKRELRDGELANPSQVALPLAAAVGGMAVPALIYVAVNLQRPEALNGWAIPVATDIAFALGILSLFGRRVPLGLKVFLLALAIFDDLGAIIVIALFYSGDLSTVSLAFAGAALAGLVVLNLVGVRSLAPYVLVGIVLWLAVLKSGVHATLAGVALALTIPIRRQDGVSPLRALEASLHPWVAFGILPLFAFANAGVSLAGVGWTVLGDSVTAGIALGLVVGKPVGILAVSYAIIRVAWAQLPAGVGWRAFSAVSGLAGVGFTMSLFIGSLAFPDGSSVVPMRLGVLAGSLLSGVTAVVVLCLTLPRQAEAASAERPPPPSTSVEDGFDRPVENLVR